MSTSCEKIASKQWLQTLLASLSDPTLKSPFGDPLPAFPGGEMQRNTTSLEGAAALQQAYGFYLDVTTALETANKRVKPDWKVVDFGSCWGRISRLFMRDVPLSNIYGLDVEPSFVETCKELFRSENFSICNALPPIGFGESSVNLVTAYSVFSHLSETAFKSWMLEFHRILVDGGVVAFTTRNEQFFDYCLSLAAQESGLSDYQKALGKMASRMNEFNERYRSGEFIFVAGDGVSGGGAMNDSFYGEAFIPRAFIENSLANYFSVEDYRATGNGYDQALFVLKKL